MRKIVWTWGLISGAVSSAMMLLFLPFADRIGFDKGEILGYTSIVLSALLIFFGVRAYRDQVGGGRLRFGRGLAVGLLIALVSSLVYVVTWEVIYFRVAPDFGEKYTRHVLDKAERQGLSEAELAKKREEKAKFQAMYDNPAFNAAITFLEPFPFGLVASLVSAGILRRKQPPAPAPA